MLSTQSKSVGALLLATMLSGCAPTAQEENPQPELAGKPATTQDWSEVTKQASDLWGKTREVADSAAGKTSEYTQEGTRFVTEYANKAWVSADEFVHDERFAGYVNSGVKSFGEQLKRLENDPSRDLTGTELVQRFGVRKIPVLNTLDRYSDARGKYHHNCALVLQCEKSGTLTDEQAAARDAALEEIKEAKRQCFMACVSGGLDVTVLGLPDQLDLPFEYADQAVDWLKLGKSASEASDKAEKSGWVSLSWAQIDPKRLDVLTPLVDKALEHENIDEAMVILLTYDFNAPVIEAR